MIPRNINPKICLLYLQFRSKKSMLYLVRKLRNLVCGVLIEYFFEDFCFAFTICLCVVKSFILMSHASNKSQVGVHLKQIFLVDAQMDSCHER